LLNNKKTLRQRDQEEKQDDQQEEDEAIPLESDDASHHSKSRVKNPYQIHQIQQNQKLANVKATGQTDKKPHKATIKRKTKQKNPIPQKTNKKKKIHFQ